LISLTLLMPYTGVSFLLRKNISFLREKVPTRCMKKATVL